MVQLQCAPVGTPRSTDLDAPMSGRAPGLVGSSRGAFRLLHLLRSFSAVPLAAARQLGMVTRRGANLCCCGCDVLGRLGALHRKISQQHRTFEANAPGSFGPPLVVLLLDRSARCRAAACLALHPTHAQLTGRWQFLSDSGTRASLYSATHHISVVALWLAVLQKI